MNEYHVSLFLQWPIQSQLRIWFSPNLPPAAEARSPKGGIFLCCPNLEPLYLKKCLDGLFGVVLNSFEITTPLLSEFPTLFSTTSIWGVLSFWKDDPFDPALLPWYIFSLDEIQAQNKNCDEAQKKAPHLSNSQFLSLRVHQ